MKQQHKRLSSISTLLLFLVAAGASGAHAQSLKPKAVDLTEPWLLQLQNTGLKMVARISEPHALSSAKRRVALDAIGARKRSTQTRKFDPRFRPQNVSYDGNLPIGTILVDTKQRYLYFIKENGRAKRYGVGVGRQGFQWKGTHRISQKREWPDWYPPAPMRRRQPELPVFMPGGVDNPLGARALYLGSTLYRIHGSSDAGSIGHAVSSGCIRMRNKDVIELYEMVQLGARVVVR